LKWHGILAVIAHGRDARATSKWVTTGKGQGPKSHWHLSEVFVTVQNPRERTQIHFL